MNDSQKYFHVILLIYGEYMEWTIRNNLYPTLQILAWRNKWTYHVKHDLVKISTCSQRCVDMM